LLKKKDRTMVLLRNVLKNLKFVKMMGWENYYYQKISERRNQEVVYLKKMQGIFVVWNLAGWCTPTNSVVAMILCLVWNNHFWTVAEMSTFIRIFQQLIETMYGIPDCMQMLLNVRVSLNRIEKFLKCGEVDLKFRSMDNRVDEYALDFQNVNFYWRQRKEKEDEEDDDSKASVKNKKIGPVAVAVAVTDPLNEPLLEISETKENDLDVSRSEVGS
jgi:ABC-type bacteriocin/lantibiotic exporter with double-glycine peptidase domain